MLFKWYTKIKYFPSQKRSLSLTSLQQEDRWGIVTWWGFNKLSVRYEDSGYGANYWSRALFIWLPAHSAVLPSLNVEYQKKTTYRLRRPWLTQLTIYACACYLTSSCDVSSQRLVSIVFEHWFYLNACSWYHKIYTHQEIVGMDFGIGILYCYWYSLCLFILELLNIVIFC